jgi:hypothetical protein
MGKGKVEEEQEGDLIGRGRKEEGEEAEGREKRME